MIFQLKQLPKIPLSLFIVLLRDGRKVFGGKREKGSSPKRQTNAIEAIKISSPNFPLPNRAEAKAIPP